MAEKTTEKDFDCLEFKDKVQAEIYKEIKDLSISEQVEYYRRSAETGPFAELRNRVREETQKRKKERWSKPSEPVQHSK